MTIEAWSQQNFGEIFRRLEDLEAMVEGLRPLKATDGASTQPLGFLPYISNINVYPTDNDSVAWGASVVYFADGRSQSITAGTLDIPDDDNRWLYVQMGNTTLLNTIYANANLARDRVPVAMVRRSTDSSQNAHVWNFSGYIPIWNSDDLGPSSVITAKIKDANVTYAKIQNVTDDRLLGRNAGTAGVVQEISYGATPSTQAFGDSAAAGTTKQPERTGHKHAMPTMASIDHGTIGGLGDDDHTQYRLESADHSHQSTGAQAGTLDHGLALTGLADDDHTIYLKEEASGGVASEVPDHTHADTTQAGTVSHANLTGVTSSQHHTPGAVMRSISGKTTPCNLNAGTNDLLGAIDNVAGYAQGATTIHVDALGQNKTVNRAAMLTIAGHTTEYIVQSSATTSNDAEGETDIAISPGLEAAVSDNAVVTLYSDRNAAVVYQNTSGKSLFVAITVATLYAAASYGEANFYCGSGTPPAFIVSKAVAPFGASITATLSFIVPDTWYYELVFASNDAGYPTNTFWFEEVLT